MAVGWPCRQVLLCSANPQRELLSFYSEEISRVRPLKKSILRSFCSKIKRPKKRISIGDCRCNAPFALSVFTPMMQQLSLTERLHIAAVQISADASLAGVQRLRAHWGDRHTEVAVRIPADLQKESISVLAATPLPLLLEDRAPELAAEIRRVSATTSTCASSTRTSPGSARCRIAGLDPAPTDSTPSSAGGWRPSGAPPRSPRPSPSASPCRRICCCAASTTCRIT